jgi:NADP-dependent 3-hydroxy acid dehydrogenase YdfG
VADINLDAAKLIAQDYGRHAEPAHLDITNKDSITALISDLLKKYGQIDALINNKIGAVY